MSTGVYYFTGTGNSLVVARDIAAGTGGSLLPIASLPGENASPHEVVGIVFPVYYGDLPVLVREFAERLSPLQGKYIFAVCTYGGAAMASLRALRSIIRSGGGELSAAFGVPMPQNSFYKPREDRQKLYLAWKKRLDFILRKIEQRDQGRYYENVFLEMLMAPVHSFYIRPLCRKAFAGTTGLPPDSGMEELIRRLDTGFVTNERCNGCSTCARVCPVDNIEMRERQPVWLHHCENCLACYNWCPDQAIEGGITSRGYYYRHPEVSIHDIMQQKQDRTRG